MRKDKKVKTLTRRRFMQGSALTGASLLAGRYMGCNKDPESQDDPFEDASVEDVFTEVDAGPDASDVDPSLPPNIVFVFSDQHRADFLGATGHPTVETPNIDRIAERGVTFDSCFTNAPLCCPARASMMTGLLPREHGCWNNNMAAAMDGPSHVRRMRDEAGYTTALIGKAHLHHERGHLADHKAILEAWGFQHSIELLGAGIPEIQSEYTDWLTSSTPPGERDKFLVLQDYMIALEEIWNEPWRTPGIDEAPWFLDTEDHIDLYTARQAASWIRDYRENRPFYLQVNFLGPHVPFDATQEFRALYDPNDARMPPGILQRVEEPWMRLVRESNNFQDVTAMTASQRQELQVLYNAKITLVDDGVGRVFDALDESGHLPNTWIIYCSDHGEMLGDHLLTGKSVFYESSVRVPCIISPPGGMPAGKSPALVDHLDVTASILQMGGLDNDQRGSSLLPKINGEGDPDKHNEYVVSEDRYCGMIRNERFKLVVDYLDETEKEIDPRAVQFFDLEADPDELVNQVGNPYYANQINELREILTNPDLPLST